MNNIKGILQRLLESRIECIIVGGLAATMYGASTVTYDVDVCLRFSPENIQNLIKTLEDIHPRVRAQTDWVSLDSFPLEQLIRAQNIYLQTDLGGLDLLGLLVGIGDYDAVRKRSREIEVFGLTCLVLDIESLIEVKEKIGRPKDKQVVLELRTILEKTSR